MIKIVAKMKVKEECVEKFLSTAKELVEKSKAEAGNISYSLNRSVSDSCTFAFIEMWKDQEAIDIHNATEHFTTILPKLGEMCESGDPVDLYNEVEF